MPPSVSSSNLGTAVRQVRQCMAIWHLSDYGVNVAGSIEASRVLISTCSAPLVQMGEQFFTNCPSPLTYDLDLQSQASQGLGQHSCQKIKVNDQTVLTGERPQTRSTDTYADVTKRIIAPATRSTKYRDSRCTVLYGCRPSVEVLTQVASCLPATPSDDHCLPRSSLVSITSTRPLDCPTDTGITTP